MAGYWCPIIHRVTPKARVNVKNSKLKAIKEALRLSRCLIHTLMFEVGFLSDKEAPIYLGHWCPAIRFIFPIVLEVLHPKRQNANWTHGRYNLPHDWCWCGQVGMHGVACELLNLGGWRNALWSDFTSIVASMWSGECNCTKGGDRGTWLCCRLWHVFATPLSPCTRTLPGTLHMTFTGCKMNQVGGYVEHFFRL
jgi:hypothetical protein